MTRFLLYLSLCAGALGAFIVVHYGLSYLLETDNPGREEYTIGMALGVLYFGVAWLAAPVLAFAGRKGLRRLEVALSLVPLVVASGVFLVITLLE